MSFIAAVRGRAIIGAMVWGIETFILTVDFTVAEISPSLRVALVPQERTRARQSAPLRARSGFDGS